MMYFHSTEVRAAVDAGIGLELATFKLFKLDCASQQMDDRIDFDYGLFDELKQNGLVRRTRH